MLRLYKASYAVKEKMQLALNHYNFQLNGVQYQQPEKMEINPYDGNGLYKGDVELQRVEYEIY